MPETRREEILGGIKLGLLVAHFIPTTISNCNEFKPELSKRKLISTALTITATAATYAVLAYKGLPAYHIPLFTNGLTAFISGMNWWAEWDATRYS
ncbi:hypothetical protein HN592_04765 [Candidatus Woesearchaeota archaeon]|jgi:hypothetical protein|nr:hypothetical protein [Candidatus Woesearchaeota archaeon]MBT4368525.1 hypothetical protein [Candidatus Woesearchaeota archaeon]MBT4713014.1 hypothetical protein [Candidatus Woesearchaeota archaeon]MBT6639926.1 hypothetical protein [Candidatus Woesearchaeota archaeon]MBT7134098.1 hypothetical protein [Candidatus Woesearchaeota archaeon]